MKKFQKGNLAIAVFPTRDDMGRAAAADLTVLLQKLLAEQEHVNMIFAAAPSQNDFLAHLAEDKTIDFSRVNAFHMDEYIGLSSEAPQGFGNFLKTHIFDLLPFRSIQLIDSSTTRPEEECARYSRLLEEYPIDIVCLGIGENGHIAFNDPGVADFHDTALVKVVTLDDVCRQQQVNDGCFSCLEDVPKTALTLTIPMLMSARYHFCIVPAKTKAQAVARTINGDITESCPASVLRNAPNAVLYLDADSSSLLDI